MDGFIPTSAAEIVIACIILVYVALQVTIDSLEIHKSKQLSRLRSKNSATHASSSFTIVIIVTKKIDSIIPLLRNIYSNHNHTIEVIVELKYTASKKAQRQLISLRRKNKWLTMRIITYKKGRTHADIIQRYATKDIVIELLPHTRLSSHFFDDVASEVLLVPVTSIVLNQQHFLDDTLTSAYSAHFEQWAAIRNSLFPIIRTIQPARPMVAYIRLHDQTKQLVLTAITAHHATVQLEYTKPKTRSFADTRIARMQNALTFPKVLAIVAIIVIVGIWLGQTTRSDILLFLMTIIIGYVVVYAINMIRMGSYSILDKINLLLLSPFALFYGLFLTLCAVTGYVTRPLLGSTKKLLK